MSNTGVNEIYIWCQNPSAQLLARQLYLFQKSGLWNSLHVYLRPENVSAIYISPNKLFAKNLPLMWIWYFMMS